MKFLFCFSGVVIPLCLAQKYLLKLTNAILWKIGEKRSSTFKDMRRALKILIEAKKVGGSLEMELGWGLGLVDDVEDESDYRRGKPCIHKIYGVDIAINMVNTMYLIKLR
jgi:hypothetical protein